MSAPADGQADMPKPEAGLRILSGHHMPKAKLGSRSPNRDMPGPGDGQADMPESVPSWAQDPPWPSYARDPSWAQDPQTEICPGWEMAKQI